METNPFRARRQSKSSPDAASPPRPDVRSGGWITAARVGIEARVVGRKWWMRAPVLLVFLWMLRGYAADPMYSSIFDGVNLGFHEAGHAAFMWFGNRMLTTAGGTIFQLGIPVVAGLYLLIKQGDPFGTAVCIFWLGTALVGAGVYAADARAQALPLVSPFGPVDVFSHDWTVMLMKYGKLSQDERIGAFLRNSGLTAMAASIASGAWLLWLMATAKKSGLSGAPREADSRSAS